MENAENYKTKLELMPELDYNVALQIIWQKAEKELKQRAWTQTQFGKLVGKERSHICAGLKAKPDMLVTYFFKLTMAFDWNLDEVFQEIKQAMLKAPRKLK